MDFMELQELFHNKHKYITITLLFFLFSCTENRGTVVKNTSIVIPSIYKLSNTEGLLFHQDTLWLNNEPYSGYIYLSLRPIKQTRSFLQGIKKDC